MCIHKARSFEGRTSKCRPNNAREQAYCSFQRPDQKLHDTTSEDFIASRTLNHLLKVDMVKVGSDDPLVAVAQSSHCSDPESEMELFAW